MRVLRKFFAHAVTIKGAIMLIVYELPKVLDKALPVGILLGSLFTFDKLSKNNELSILRGIGVPFMRICSSVILLGGIFSIFCFYVGSELIPRVSNHIRENADYNEHFVYVQKDEQNRPIQSVIVSNFIPNYIKNLVVVDFAIDDEDETMKFKSIVFAPYANVQDDRWILPVGQKYSINARGVYEEKAQIKDYPILIGENTREIYELMNNIPKRDRGFTNKQMRRHMYLLKKMDFDDEYRSFKTKFFQRFLHPLTCLLFAIIGCLLGFSPPRSQRLIGFTIAVGIVFGYYITVPFFDLLAEKGTLPPIITASIPFILFVIAIFIIKKAKDL